MVNMSSSACVGCSPTPSPALTMGQRATRLARWEEEEEEDEEEGKEEGEEEEEEEQEEEGGRLNLEHLLKRVFIT